MNETTYLAYGECYQVMPRAAVQQPIVIGFDMASGSDSAAVVDVKLVAGEDGSGLIYEMHQIDAKRSEAQPQEGQ